MSTQDILRIMMTQLDEASDQIPEGFYIQFCDHIKNLHKKTASIPRDAVVRNVPFAPRIPVNTQMVNN
jgi:hypothetical protein